MLKLYKPGLIYTHTLFDSENHQPNNYFLCLNHSSKSTNPQQWPRFYFCVNVEDLWTHTVTEVEESPCLPVTASVGASVCEGIVIMRRTHSGCRRLCNRSAASCWCQAGEKHAALLHVEEQSLRPGRSVQEWDSQQSLSKLRGKRCYDGLFFLKLLNFYHLI